MSKNTEIIIRLPKGAEINENTIRQQIANVVVASFTNSGMDSEVLSSLPKDFIDIGTIKLIVEK